MFAGEMCKSKTNGCSANEALLQDSGSTGEDENRRTELQLAVVAQSTVGWCKTGAVEIQRDEISVAASCCEGMVTNPCCLTLLQQKNNKHLG